MSDKKQIINCTVESCKYNNTDTQMCKLKQIVVSPLPDCDTKKCDESMCSSYEYQENH